MTPETTHRLPAPTLFPVPGREIETMHAARQAARNGAVKYLSLACISLTVAICGVLVWTNGVYRASLNRHPYFLGIDQQTRAITMIRPEMLTMPVNEALIRNTIENFVQWHYERLPVISRRDYNLSLWAMAPSLREQASIQKEKEEVRALSTPNHSNDVEVRVQNSVFTGTKNGCRKEDHNQPCLATVFYEKTFLDAASHEVLETRPYIASIAFWLKPEITPDEVRNNATGLEVVMAEESEGRKH